MRRVRRIRRLLFLSSRICQTKLTSCSSRSSCSLANRESHEGPIHELSLGGANLIFLTLKLLEFKYQKAKQSIANFLLIEEPEAHIHTHIQKTLFDKLKYDDTQIIYSTHSTHISEVSNVQNVNILGREGDRCEAYQPAIGLNPEEIGNIQRYLDAVRSNLLFAKSVLLVEGDAEEILVPILIKNVLGVSLDELGISLINIRSTGFQNVAVLSMMPESGSGAASSPTLTSPSLTQRRRRRLRRAAPAQGQVSGIPGKRGRQESVIGRHLQR